MDWIMEYLVHSCYVVVPVLCLIGGAIKRVPRVPDWTIPFILGGLSILACSLLMGPGIQAALQGVLCAGASVYLHQMVKQGKKRG